MKAFNENLSFKDELTTARKRMGYTQKQLAQESGISLRTIQSYERGERMPREHHRNQLAAALGLAEKTQRKYYIRDISVFDGLVKLEAKGEGVSTSAYVEKQVIESILKTQYAEKYGKMMIRHDIHYALSVMFGEIGKEALFDVRSGDKKFFHPPDEQQKRNDEIYQFILLGCKMCRHEQKWNWDKDLQADFADEPSEVSPKTKNEGENSKTLKRAENKRYQVSTTPKKVA